MNADHSDTDDANGDGEGVWSPDIEQCFREALLLFPPCGRRKHILQEEGGGKMYGRNELIARHIMMRTGKIRTRKQVSSHIQVLARRKAKAEVANASGGGSSSPSSVASGAIISSTGRGASMRPHSASSHPDHSSSQPQQQQLHHQANNQHSASAAQLNHSHLHLHHQHHNNPINGTLQTVGSGPNNNGSFYGDLWMDRPIVTQKIRLVTFSAFIEHRRPTLPLASDIVNNNNTINNNNNYNNINNNHDNNNQAISAHSQAANIFQQQQEAATAIQLKVDTPHCPGTDIDIADGTTGAGVVSSFTQNQPNPISLTPTTPTVLASPTSAGSHLLDQTIAFSGAPNINAAHTNHLNRLVINAPLTIMTNNNATQSGFTRHSYVKIDFRQPQSGILNNNSKLELIDISQIQDKFPEISGSEGLFQRGSPDAFFLVKFWADLSNDYEYNVDDQNSYFGFTSHFETMEPYKNITCSTKACSYGLQVVEKVEKIYGAFNSSNGRYSYGIERSPMCEFMIQFIKKLRQLPRASQMNSVLENFTVLQVVTNEATSEILLCLAFVFEIASPEQNEGPQYHVYKLTKD